jgi:hypothetical protein
MARKKLGEDATQGTQLRPGCEIVLIAINQKVETAKQKLGLVTLVGPKRREMKLQTNAALTTPSSSGYVGCWWGFLGLS